MAGATRNTLKPKAGYYNIKHELFWAISIPLVSGIFYFGKIVGTTIYDKNLIELSENTKLLKDSIKIQKKTIEYMRRTSDSALNILGHMPYDKMKLDSSEFHSVQSNIEAAGAALYLNINYKH